ncbi:4'-phosphopantetheinyl transferase superfamily protein [Streptomyces sp. NBC_01283]|uniref:4'-phosphopantetheinyl transferase family protein n=1 Tax=Streptomyces sp. NBC_01283 TaxID=2903812 RepID=UPI00352E6448|nr:4'-phosphopantetheinyl transferase superfamily protein [Streptomyces sp. NBC_01283]
MTGPPAGAVGLGGPPVSLDPARPLAVRHLTERLTLAVVSIAWLRAQGDTARARTEKRHLSAREAAQARLLPSPRRRYEWLAGRLALKHAVTAYQHRRLGRSGEPRAIQVSALRDGPRAGKPVVDVPAEVGLSHSGDFAVAVCGPHAIGVDLEHRRELPPMVSELLTHDGDPYSARAGPRQVAAMPLALRWACKEAVLKYYGFGLRIDTREVGLTGWEQDGRFRWSAGPGLLRRAPAAGSVRLESWAGETNGYSLALVWT